MISDALFIRGKGLHTVSSQLLFTEIGINILLNIDCLQVYGRANVLNET